MAFFFFFFFHRKDACVGDYSLDVMDTDFHEQCTDGSLFTRIADLHGGKVGCIFGIFIALSTDDFQALGNQSYENWKFLH